MNIINKTDLTVAKTTWKIRPPQDTLTLIVKGTFTMTPGKTAQVAEKDDRLPVTGDEYYNEELEGSLRYESDFAPFKPRADLLLVGKAYSPDGQARQGLRVTFGAGEKQRDLWVFGNRHAKKTILGVSGPSPAEPFTEMELCYENSFGGEGYGKNPVGKGWRGRKTRSREKIIDLANIRDVEADNNTLSRVEKDEPAGFGPLSRTWEQRMAKTGRYGKKWLKERWPWFPDDFDWGFFNAAPEAMQYEGYLKGDEPLYFSNLHPEHTEYHCRLPGIRVRCFLEEMEGENTLFKEVRMNLDTLWVDIGAEKLVLVWRGLCDVQSPDCKEIERVLVASELPEDPVLPIAFYHELMDAPPEQPEEKKTEAAAAKQEKEEAARGVEEEQPEVDELEKELDAEINEALGEMRAMLAAAGVSPEILAALDGDVDPAAFLDKLKKDLNLNPEQAGQFEKQGKDTARQMMEEQGIDPALLDDLDEAQSASDEIPSEDDEPDAKLEAEIAAALGQAYALLDKSGLDPKLIEALKKEKDPEAFMNTFMEGLNLDPRQAEQFQKEAKEKTRQMLAEHGYDPALLDELEQLEKEEEADEEELPPTREDIQAAVEKGEGFSGKDLSGMDFSGMDLKRADFSKAVIANANFAKADLTEADLSQADLSGADLRGAILSGSKFGFSDLSQANLAGTNLKKAGLSTAIMQEADLSGSDLSGADMSNANLGGASLKGAVLTNAVLDRTDLSKADLSESDMTGASLNYTDLGEADLSRADLSAAKGAGTNFKKAVLTEAALRNGEFQACNFSGCTLDRTDFEGASLKQAMFEGASGESMVMKQADLTELKAGEGCSFPNGRFQKIQGAGSMWVDADLKGADFTYSDMERADFTGADLANSNFTAVDLKSGNLAGANLKEARFPLANLFQGNLERADLTGSDFRGSNLYGAEFLDAVIADTQFARANLKMTKLKS